MREKIEKQMGEYVEKYLSLYPFSGCVAAIYKGEVVFNKAYGLASIEHDVPNTPQIRHKIWSVTKQFTAGAILMLEERGLLKVEDSLKKYFPDCPALDERITIHHCLTHTSGLFNYSDIRDNTFHMIPPKTADLLKQFSEFPLDFEPGTQYNYCNTGYWFLGQLIERISGMSYAQFMQENIFAPLAMHNTGVDRDKPIVKGLATGYYLNHNDIIRCNYVNMDLGSEAGGMYSTAEDLLKWHAALMGDKLLRRESIDKMNADHMNNYGYGVEVFEINGKRIVSHGGGYEGFYSYFVRHLDDDFAAAGISNYGFGMGEGVLTEALRDITLGNPYEMPARPPVHEIDNKLLDEYIGKYEEVNLDYELKRVGDELHLIYNKYCNAPAVFTVYPISDTELQHTWTDETFDLGKTDDGIPMLNGIKKCTV